jgi:UDP-glucose 4-epimerase
MARSHSSRDRNRHPRSRRPRSRPFDPERRVVAVTGAHGFFGSRVLRCLEEDPRYRTILAIDIRRPEVSMAKTQFHKIDLTSPTADTEVAAVLDRGGADTLVHAAFLHGPTHAESWAHELELIGTIRVLNAAAEVGLHKLVQWSLTAVYGACRDNPNFLTESHPLRGHPATRYLKDRVAAEQEVSSFREEHPETVVTVLRTAATLGPSIPNFVTRYFRTPVVPMLMGYDPLMQFVHEDDAVDAFKLAIDNDVPGVFNIAADGVLPYSTVLAMMGRVPLPLPIFLAFPLAHALWATQATEMPPYFLDMLRYCCVSDTRAAREQLGFQPRFDIRSAIHDFLGVDVEPADLATEGGNA